MSEQQRRRRTGTQGNTSTQRGASGQRSSSSQRNAGTQSRSGTGKKKLTKKQLRRRRQRNRRIAMAIMCLTIIVLLVIGWKLIASSKENTSDQQGKVTEENIEVTPTDTPEPTPTPEPLPVVDFSVLTSKAGILVRMEDGAVVAEKEADTIIYPASMTKIMTALIGIENISDLNQTITISQATYDRLYLEGASLAGFPAGEPITVKDMLYGVMLPSGAECCVGIAEFIYGSESAFVDAMNAKAQELGMTNTHFVTTTGLHDEQHYTTVRDLTKLLEYALQNETFKTIYCTKEYTTQPNSSNPNGLHFTSTMFKKITSSSVNGGEILGGKTGYTSEAGQCLASYAQVDGKDYILVTAGAPGGPSTEPYHVLDAIAVYDQISTQTSTEVTSETEVQ